MCIWCNGLREEVIRLYKTNNCLYIKKIIALGVLMVMMRCEIV